MTYTLYIGNKRYSSWSMRPWIVLKALNIPFEEKLQLFKPGIAQPEFRAFSPTGKVPCLYDAGDSGDSGSIAVWDSLAIIEYIAESHPSVWPSDPAARAFARCATSEMHSGFSSIRNETGMNVGLRIDLGTPSEALQKDLARLSELFNQGLESFGGPWLAGKEFTAVDAFFSPVATRIKTYGLKLEGEAQEYIERLFEHSAVQAWVQDGIREKAREPTHEEECTSGRTVLRDLSRELEST